MMPTNKGREFSHLARALPTIERSGDRRRLRGLYAITPEQLCGDALLSACELALLGGAGLLQYRQKQAAPELRHSDASRLRTLCDRFGVRLIINDDVELALSVRADGVHLGEDDASLEQARMRLGDNALIGISCYDSRERAQDASARGADYIAFGAFFPTRTKLTQRRAGLELLQWAADLPPAKVAIGGLRPDNAGAVVDAGADMLAVVDSLWSAADIEARAREFTALFSL